MFSNLRKVNVLSSAYCAKWRICVGASLKQERLFCTIPSKRIFFLNSFFTYDCVFCIHRHTKVKIFAFKTWYYPKTVFNHASILSNNTVNSKSEQILSKTCYNLRKLMYLKITPNENEMFTWSLGNRKYLFFLLKEILVTNNAHQKEGNIVWHLVVEKSVRSYLHLQISKQ